MSELSRRRSNTMWLLSGVMSKVLMVAGFESRVIRRLLLVVRSSSQKSRAPSGPCIYTRPLPLGRKRERPPPPDGTSMAGSFTELPSGCTARSGAFAPCSPRESGRDRPVPGESLPRGLGDGPPRRKAQASETSEARPRLELSDHNGRTVVLTTLKGFSSTRAIPAGSVIRSVNSLRARSSASSCLATSSPSAGGKSARGNGHPRTCTNSRARQSERPAGSTTIRFPRKRASAGVVINRVNDDLLRSQSARISRSLSSTE